MWDRTFHHEAYNLGDGVLGYRLCHRERRNCAMRGSPHCANTPCEYVRPFGRQLRFRTQDFLRETDNRMSISAFVTMKWDSVVGFAGLAVFETILSEEVVSHNSRRGTSKVFRKIRFWGWRTGLLHPQQTRQKNHRQIRLFCRGGRGSRANGPADENCHFLWSGCCRIHLHVFLHTRRTAVAGRARS